MGRYTYDSGRVSSAISELSSACNALKNTGADIQQGISTIQSARGAEYLDLKFGGMATYPEEAIRYIDNISDQIRAKATEIEEYNDASFFSKLFGTAGMGLSKLAEGFASGFENIGDGIVTIAGFIGGIFNSDFKKSCDEYVAKDHVGNFFAENINGEGTWINKHSFFSSDGTMANIFKGVASIGQKILTATIAPISTTVGTIHEVKTNIFGSNKSEKSSEHKSESLLDAIAAAAIGLPAVAGAKAAAEAAEIAKTKAAEIEAREKARAEAIAAKAAADAKAKADAAKNDSATQNQNTNSNTSTSSNSNSSSSNYQFRTTDTNNQNQSNSTSNNTSSKSNVNNNSKPNSDSSNKTDKSTDKNKDVTDKNKDTTDKNKDTTDKNPDKEIDKSQDNNKDTADKGNETTENNNQNTQEPTIPSTPSDNNTTTQPPAENSNWHSGGGYSNNGYTPSATPQEQIPQTTVPESNVESSSITDNVTNSADQVTTTIEDVIKGDENYTKIPTPTTGNNASSKSSSGSSVLPIAAGVIAAAGAGIGAKVYLDRKNNNDNDEDENTDIDTIETEQWNDEDNSDSDYGYESTTDEELDLTDEYPTESETVEKYGARQSGELADIQ